MQSREGQTMKRGLSILAAACILMPRAALAHTGAGATEGIIHGLSTPSPGSTMCWRWWRSVCSPP